MGQEAGSLEFRDGIALRTCAQDNHNIFCKTATTTTSVQYRISLNI